MFVCYVPATIPVMINIEKAIIQNNKTKLTYDFMMYFK